ncbi:hypothetical protein Neosp_013834 [[Neocosmospora] mangrovei]
MIIGNTRDIIATICYIVDTLALRHPSSSAVVEEGDYFAHFFSRTTRAVIFKALAKVGAAFDVMVTRHQGEHKLLGCYKPEIIKTGAPPRSPWEGLRLQPSDVGFLDWNTAVQNFRGEVVRAMEDAHMAQGAIDIVVSELPI